MRSDAKRGSTREDLSGQVYGDWIVIDPAPRRKAKTHWFCLCTLCGEIRPVQSSNLKSGSSRNCGCTKGDQITSAKTTAVGEYPLRFHHHIRRNAEQRHLEFKVDMKYLWDIFVRQESKCALTGVSLTMPHKRLGRNGHTASLDRINNTQGYVVGNVRWIHKWVNVMRMDMSDHEFLAWCRLVVQHHNHM